MGSKIIFHSHVHLEFLLFLLKYLVRYLTRKLQVRFTPSYIITVKVPRILFTVLTDPEVVACIVVFIITHSLILSGSGHVRMFVQVTQPFQVLWFKFKWFKFKWFKFKFKYPLKCLFTQVWEHRCNHLRFGRKLHIYILLRGKQKGNRSFSEKL